MNVDNVNSALSSVADHFLNWHDIGLLAGLLLAAFILGRLVAMLLRRLNNFISHRADETKNLSTVERLRRLETMVVMSIAVLRTLLVVFALYLWWVTIHPHQQPTAIIGAGAIFAVFAGGVFGPVLRDLASGSMMMSEHWFGVGDHIKIEPFTDMQGVVERVTLRSTRIRGLNGEVIWVSNQNIAGVRVTTKGLMTIAIELFVSNLKDGQRLVDQTDLRLPAGPLLVATPLRISSANQVAENMWHITAVGQTAPGRQWLLENYALDVIKELNEKKKNPVLLSDPVARNADSEAERKLARTIQNAQKVPTKPSLNWQLQREMRGQKTKNK